jgi:Major Facilitator Superfamily
MTTPTRTRTAVLTIVLASYLMLVLDISIVITALPEIRAGLGFSDTGLSWVQNSYTLAFGGLLLLGARAGDLLGRRRMFVVGIALFTAASLAIGLAPSPAWLLTARVVQGAGAAIVAPSTLALLSTTFSGQERTRAVAWYGAVAGVGASLGLVLGGVLTTELSWRVGFFLNVPIGLAMIVAAPRYLARTDPQPGRFDVTGALSSTLGMTALVYGIVGGGPVPMVVGVALLGVSVITEWRAAQQRAPARRRRRGDADRHGLAEPPHRRHPVPGRRGAADGPDRRRAGRGTEPAHRRRDRPRRAPRRRRRIRAGERRPPGRRLAGPRRARHGRGGRIPRRPGRPRPPRRHRPHRGQRDARPRTRPRRGAGRDADAVECLILILD